MAKEFSHDPGSPGSPAGPALEVELERSALDVEIERGLAAAREAGVRAAVATLPIAALLVDRDGHALELNPAAKAIVAGDVLFLGLGKELRCRIPHDDAAIGRALSAAIASGAADVLRVTDFGGAGDVVVAVVPLAGRERAVLLLLPEAVTAEALAPTLAALYRLDAAQTDMALAFHRGERVDDVAARTGAGTYAAAVTRIETLQRLGATDAAAASRRITALARLLPPGRTAAPAPALGRIG